MKSQLTSYIQKADKWIVLCMFISLLSMLRILFLPLGGDEITYAEIAGNIMRRGWFAYQEMPSTLTPIMPLWMAAFYMESLPQYGLFFAKLLNLFWLWWAIKYMYLFFKNIQLPELVSLSIIGLTFVNNNFVAMSLTLYPDMFIISLFWMFLYRLTQPVETLKSWILLILPLMFLVLTRYVYAVFGLPVLLIFINYLRELYSSRSYQKIGKLFIYTIICILPLLFWFKYVFSVESFSDANLSYFNRFKNNSFLYNIQAGLGIIQHEETKNVNGIPAFISLFLPITGFRSWILSLVLAGSFWMGYLSHYKKNFYSTIILIILLLMGGLAIAGTGFSRYWLPLTPLFLLGFYQFFKLFKFDDRYWVYGAKALILIYVINELRINWIVIKKIIS
jgi:hypothetical protein